MEHNDVKEEAQKSKPTVATTFVQSETEEEEERKQATAAEPNETDEQQKEEQATATDVTVAELDSTTVNVPSKKNPTKLQLPWTSMQIW